MLRFLRIAVVTVLLGSCAILASSAHAQQPAPAAPGTSQRIPGPGYEGPAVVQPATSTAPAMVAGYRIDGRTWKRQDVAAGRGVWVRPFADQWSWTWTAATGWLAVQRTNLRTDDGTTAALDGQRTTAALRGPFRSDGRFLRDSTGRAVFFHGVNAVWKKAPYVPPSTLDGTPEARSYFDDRDAKLLADNGLNSVRLGVMWTGVEPTANRFDATYLQRMRAITDMLAARDVSVLVDSHQDMYSEAYMGNGFPDWARVDKGIKPIGCCGFPFNYVSPSSVLTWNAFWANRGKLRDQFADQWQHVASSFDDAPNVIGYDLMNEPFPGSSFARCVLPGGCKAFDTGPLQGMYEKTAASIRSVDTKTPIWWEGTIGNGGGGINNVGTKRPLRDPARNTVLSFHSYCNLGGMVPGLSRAKDPTCPGLHAGNFQRQLAAGRRNGSVPVLTEFGASDDLVDIARVAALADRNMTSWHYWHYGGWGDHTTTGGTGTTQGLFEDDLDRTTLKPGKADVLVRTYPQAVAGTPISYGFAPSRPDRRFVLSYMAEPKVAADTVIYVPVHRHYEGGYKVRVTGPATVTSAPGAQLLTLRGTGVRGTVIVSVLRTGH
ncbi:MAG: endoglycoceramidase [Thermoleophilia bacterium]|nr:endoglycoceramidase [Thermoleophilia bacterium]